MEPRKEVRLDPTNAVIVSEEAGTNTIIGIHQRCPWCGTVLLHNRDTFLITKVGGVGKWECGKCRNQYYVLSIPVPPVQTTAEFYEKIRKKLFEED